MYVLEGGLPAVCLDTEPGGGERPGVLAPASCPGLPGCVSVGKSLWHSWTDLCWNSLIPERLCCI